MRINRLRSLWHGKRVKYLVFLGLLFSLVVIVLFWKATSEPILKSHKEESSLFSSPLDDVKIQTKTLIGKEGFFRVGQSTKGRWWLIDPENQPFFYKGVTSIGDGRGISPTISPLSSYTEIVKQKYGGDWTKLRKVIFNQLKSWNFNAIGAWSASDLWDQGMPYTWYRWIDQVSYPLSSPTNMGLINLKDEPNKWHIDLLTQLNAKAESIVTTEFDYKPKEK